MKLGKSRFEFQLDKIDKLFAEAKVQEDPAQCLTKKILFKKKI